MCSRRDSEADSMNRRRICFPLRRRGGGTRPPAPPDPPPPRRPMRVLMKLGCQTTPTNEQHIRYLARYGVQAICGFPQIAGGPAVCHGRRAQSDARNGGEERRHRGSAGAAVSGLHQRRPRQARGHHAGAESRAGPGHRAVADPDPELRRRRYSGDQVQPVHRRRPADGTFPGRGDATYSTWRLADSHPATH